MERGDSSQTLRAALAEDVMCANRLSVMPTQANLRALRRLVQKLVSGLTIETDMISD